jgi:hypothetical protein
MIEPDDIAKWTYDVFGNYKSIKPEKTEDSQTKKNRYLEYIGKTGKISLREATSEPFSLSRLEWNQIIQELESS